MTRVPFLCLVLLAVACGRDPATAVTRACLAEVTYRYAGVDTFATAGAVAPEGGPLCLELAGDRVTITNGEALFVPLTVSSGGTALWYLWPAGTRAEAQVFRKDGRLYLSPLAGDLLWLLAPGVVITEAGSLVIVDFTDADETFHAVFRP